MGDSGLYSVGRVREYTKSSEFAKQWRYLSVSAISTVLSLGLLYFFYRVVRVGAAWKANVLAALITTIPSYYLNRTWAWGRTGKSHFMKEVVPFWVIAFVSLGLSTGAVDLAEHGANHLTHSHTIVTAFVEGANLFTYGVLWIAKYMFFNRVLFKHRHGIDGPRVIEPALLAADEPLDSVVS